MNKILRFYEDELGGKDFYNVLKQKSKESPDFYNPYIIFSDINSSISTLQSDSPKVNSGDVRIDMPILCGNIKSQRKVLFLGLEPRHTDDLYNIMKKDNKVFATPFGIDKWYSKSKQSVYASAFEKFLKLDALFLFSDFVKEYKVVDVSKKASNDQQARSNFKNLLDNKYKSILEEEIKIFAPTLIIGLGKGDISRKVPKTWLNKYNVKVISHPTNGNFNRMQSELAEILK
jgi:hypothetical protein